MKFYTEFTKSDMVNDEFLVWGIASTDSIDSQGEIVTREAIEDALENYMKFANVRLMHQPIIAGVCKEAKMTERGLEICVKVVDEKIVKMIKEGAIKGFSIGGRVLKRAADDAKKILKMILSEISFVDRPANEQSIITMYKADMLEGEAIMENEQQVQNVKELQETQEIEKVNASCVWDATRAMDALNTLVSLCLKEKNEENAEHCAALEQAMEGIKSFITAKLNEPEKSEVEGAPAQEMVEMSEKPEDLEKVGRELSAKNMQVIQDLHDKCSKMGAKCVDKTMSDLQLADLKADIQKAEKAGFDEILKSELAKAEDLHKQEVEQLKKSHSDELEKAEAKQKDLSEQIIKMQDKIKQLEDIPMPAKGSLKSVSKSSDASGTEPKTETSNSFLEDIKKVHQSGGKRLGL